MALRVAILLGGAQSHEPWLFRRLERRQGEATDPRINVITSFLASLASLNIEQFDVDQVLIMITNLPRQDPPNRPGVSPVFQLISLAPLRK